MNMRKGIVYFSFILFLMLQLSSCEKFRVSSEYIEIGERFGCKLIQNSKNGQYKSFIQNLVFDSQIEDNHTIATCFFRFIQDISQDTFDLYIWGTKSQIQFNKGSKYEINISTGYFMSGLIIREDNDVIFHAFSGADSENSLIDSIPFSIISIVENTSKFNKLSHCSDIIINREVTFSYGTDTVKMYQNSTVDLDNYSVYLGIAQQVEPNFKCDDFIWTPLSYYIMKK
jgi:hypothetical protein